MCLNVTVDFDSLPDGTPTASGSYVSDEWLDKYGLILSSSGGYLDIPRLLNTSDPSIEKDLGSPNKKCTPPGIGSGEGGEPGMPGENCVPQGNVLIIQESNKDFPDDSRDGGVIAFDFSPNAEAIYSVGLMDVGGNGTNITVIFEDKTGSPEDTTITVVGLGNNAVQMVPINMKSVSQLRVSLAGSAAVTYISYCFTPDGGSSPPVLVSLPSQVPSRSPAPSAMPSLRLAPSQRPSVLHSSQHNVGSSLPPLQSQGYVVVEVTFSVLPKGSTIAANGAYVSTEWLEFGLTLSASGGQFSFPRLLNTSDVSNDASLGSPNVKCSSPGPGVGSGGEPGMPGENCDPLGNVLIIQKEDAELPEASSNGGSITCDFVPQCILVYSIRLMGIEGNSTVITILHDDGTRSTTISLVGLGQNSVQTISIGIGQVSQLDVNFSASGAVASVAIGKDPNDKLLSPEPMPVPPSPISSETTRLSDKLVHVSIDFDKLADGSMVEGGLYVSDEWLDEFGLKLSAKGEALSSPRLWNTSDVGSVSSLGSPNEECSLPGPGSGAGGEPGMPGENCIPLGNVLIIQSNETEDPDASSKGGVIVFHFSPIVRLVYSISLMGVMGNSTIITVVHEDGTRTTAITVIGLGRNSVQSISIGMKRVSEIELCLSGIAAVVDISIGKDPTEVVRQPERMPAPSQFPSSPSPDAKLAVSESTTSFPTSMSPLLALSGSSAHSSAPVAYVDDCEDVIIDFNTLPDGSKLPGGSWCDDEWLDEYGFILSASGGFLDIPRLLSTSDVANVDYARHEQGSPNEKCDPSGPGVGDGGEPNMKGENCVPQGNVLIIMPEGLVENSTTDGVITFDFRQSMYFVHAIGLMNISGNNTKVTVVHDNNGVGLETTAIHVDGLGVNSVQTISIGLQDVSQVSAHISGMSAVAFISFCFHREDTLFEIPVIPAVSPVPSMIPSRSLPLTALPSQSPSRG